MKFYIQKERQALLAVLCLWVIHYSTLYISYFTSSGLDLSVTRQWFCKTAEYVGVFVYRFNSIENLVNTLFDMGWLKSVEDKEKPAICVVKN